MTGREINKRTVENFIFAGAFDSLPGTRSQKIAVYSDLMDARQRQKKESIEGQMSLFDFAAPEDRSRLEVSFPPIPEYTPADRLAFEKQVLGLYISGHPLEQDAALLQRNVTAQLADFNVDEETDEAGVEDGSIQVVGGLVDQITRKTTRRGSLMLVLQLMDLTDTIEVLCYPRDTDTYPQRLAEGSRVFIRGRVSLGEDAKGKLICEKILFFEDLPKEVFVLFEKEKEFREKLPLLTECLKGNGCTVQIREGRQVRRIPASDPEAQPSEEVAAALIRLLGAEYVVIREKRIEEQWKKPYNSLHG